MMSGDLLFIFGWDLIFQKAKVTNMENMISHSRSP